MIYRNEEYDYQPNAIRRALSKKESYKIGVVLIQKKEHIFELIQKKLFN